MQVPTDATNALCIEALTVSKSMPANQSQLWIMTGFPFSLEGQAQQCLAFRSVHGQDRKPATALTEDLMFAARHIAIQAINVQNRHALITRTKHAVNVQNKHAINMQNKHA
eukprot:1150777-Pelagomonas_calceolata.AAC.5